MGQQADRFWAELRALYEAAGGPTLSSLVALGTRQRPPLAVADSTLHEWLHGRTVPGPRHTRFLLVLVAHLQAQAVEYEARPEGWWQLLLTGARQERDRARGGRPGTLPPGAGSPAAPGPTEPGPVTLPPAPTGFAGREGAVAQLMGWLEPTSEPTEERAGEPAGERSAVVVSAVAGMGGVGKTALALHTAHRARARGWFPGGVLFADLHGYSQGPPLEPGSVADRFLRALGVTGRELPATVEEKLDLWRLRLDGLARQGRPLLVVLDNARSAAQTAPLLPGPPHRALITSRQDLSGLSARRLGLDPLDSAEALDLLDRALRAGGTGDDRVTDQAADAVRLVGLCGRLPLALRIIAALLRDEPDRSLADQAADLADARTRLDALDYADTDAHGRTLAVRATFDLSYRHLTPGQARAFRLLSAVPGPDLSTTAAAELLGSARARPLLAALARAHLLQRSAGERWSLHDLLRLYAREKGREHAEGDAREEAVRRLLGFYVSTAEAAGSRLNRGAPGAGPPSDRFTDRADALTWLEAERLNLVAVATSPGDLAGSAAVPLSFSLAVFFERRRYLDDWITVATRACAVLEAGPPSAVRIHALNRLGGALCEARRFEEAIGTHHAALALCEVTGDWRDTAASRSCLGSALMGMRRFEEAAAVQTRALDAYRERHDRLGEAVTLLDLGLSLAPLGRGAEAVDAQVRAYRLFEELDLPYQRAAALNNLGNTLQHLRRFAEAAEAHSRSAVVYREYGDPYRESMALANLAAALRETDRPERAATVLADALSLARASGGPHDEAAALDHLGVALTAAGRPAEAVDAHARALTLFRRTGDLRGESAALMHSGLAQVELGRYEEAVDLHTRAVAVARKVGHRDREGVALSNLGTALRLRGRIDEALDAHHGALAVFREAGERRRESGALADLSRAYRAAGRLDEALGAFTRSLALTTEADGPADEAVMRCDLGELLWHMGRFEEAVASGLAGAARFREAGAVREAEVALITWVASHNELRRGRATGGVSPYKP
ncbi:tetratricopeptide repeat protein [Streptomyces sp. NPDC056716]|uniref:tetratricopeptide repeat protein n=1 Tax=unclassified Streptomyces TaxID=2593676 RepID=UPI0036BD0470